MAKKKSPKTAPEIETPKNKKTLQPIEEQPSSTSAPIVTMTELVLPSHTNSLGTIFGGVIMGWVDIAGAIACQRYAKSPVVTVSIDYLHFIVPMKTGYVARIQAQVTYAGTTSMETEVLVDAENAITGEIKRATKAYLTYVAIDANGRPKKVPAFTAETKEEKARYQEAQKRRKQRLTLSKIIGD